MDAHGMPLRLLITEGAAADCGQACKLVEGADVAYLLADKAYDTNEILGHCEGRGVESVIPSKRNRKVQQEHDGHRY